MDADADGWQLLNPKLEQMFLLDANYYEQQHPKCHPADEFKCSLSNCSIHKLQPGNFTLMKLNPTKFGRSLPVCWLIAASQLLGVIDWPQSL